jgi:hypothetical protein
MVLRQGYAVALLTACLVGSFACATGPELDLTLHESDQGRVYLERFSDRSLQAAHPIRVSADTMARVLRGVNIKENRGFLVNAIAGKQEPVRVLRDEDVEFLAPLLVEGLARAASDQQVGFRFGRTGAPAEWKQGSLYAYGRSLYLTLPWLIPMDRLGAGGPTLSPTILFIPESARRPDSYRDARSTESTVVIDYALLAALPADTGPPPPPVSPAGRPVPPTGQATAPPLVPPVIQEPTQTRERELEEMKKELQDIKRQLAEQEAERNAQKQKGSSKQKPPSTP